MLSFTTCMYPYVKKCNTTCFFLLRTLIKDICRFNEKSCA